jgi:hypothetical protein
MVANSALTAAGGTLEIFVLEAYKVEGFIISYSQARISILCSILHPSLSFSISFI